MEKPSRIALVIIVIAVALGGCVYPEKAPLRLPEQPLAAPAGVEHKDGAFDGVRETKLYEQSWRPQGQPRAVVVLVHGLKEHSGRYRAIAERLAQQGFAVHTFDLRGHGRSAGWRLWVDAFDDYVGDLDIFVTRVRESEPGLPMLLFGHSLGSVIATEYTITKKPEIKGLALSGASLEIGISGATRGRIRFVAALAPNSGLYRFPPKLFLRDPAAIAESYADPLVSQARVPARTEAELLSAIHRVGDHIAGVSVPILVMSGEADRLTPPWGSKDLVERAGARDKTLKVYPHASHDLLHDPMREQVMSDLVKWMSDRTPTVARSASASAKTMPMTMSAVSRQAL